jgi:hypothetical protein
MGGDMGNDNDRTNHQCGNARLGRGRSGGEGDDANVSKRPASTSPDQRRSDAVLPDEVQSAVEESELQIDDVSEEEVANRKAFEDCLRDIDKAVPVWKLAHQLPKDRWNEEESKFESWNERKKCAMEATIESISKDLMSGKIARPHQGQNECDSDSSDATYPPRAGRTDKTNGKQLSPMEESFIKALPYCLPLDRGFHVTEFSASEICYCPCGPNVEPWRKAHQVFPNVCDKTKRFQPNALMDHLKKEGGVYEEREQKKKVKRDLHCMYHYAAAEYLRLLYADWHGKGKLPKKMEEFCLLRYPSIALTATLSPVLFTLPPTKAFKHKALSQPQTKDWRKAEDEEGRLIRRALEMERKENRRKEEEMKNLKAEMEKKDQDTAFFRDQAKHHQARAEKLEKLMDRFQVENKGKENKLTDSQISKYEMMMTDYFGECARRTIFDVCAYSDLCIHFFCRRLQC